MFHGKHGVSPLLGPVGGLLSLHGLSSNEVSRPSASTFRTSLSGVRREQRGPRARREWSASVASAWAEHYHHLEQLESGALGPGPFWWFDEYSQVTNMLPPAVSMLEPGTWTGGMQGGAGTLPDGTQYLRSVTQLGSGSVFIGQRMAVPMGATITASVYANAAPGEFAGLRVIEYDPEGVAVGPGVNGTWAGTVRDAVGERIVNTVKLSARTTSIQLRVNWAAMLTLPAVTLTGEVLPWATGRGCAAASFRLGGESVQKALPAVGHRRAGYTMTVTELG